MAETRPGGLYRAPDGSYHDADGKPVPEPTAAEVQAAAEREMAQWRQERTLVETAGRVYRGPDPDAPKAKGKAKSAVTDGEKADG